MKIVKRFTNVFFLVFVAGLLWLSSCKHDIPIVIPIDPVIPIDTSDITDTTDITDTVDINPDPCDPDSVYFETDILPMLISNCAMSGCHDDASHEDGVILTSYSKVMNTADVKPFDLNDSKLYEAITETDSDDKMPPPPNTPLSSDQVALIAKWIMQGALNITCNANFDSCDVSNVTYSGTVAPILQNFCVGCHSGSAPSGGILLNQYNAVAAVALSGQLVGSINGASGFAKMPPAGGSLSSCNIEKITKWVTDGAPNN
jgi:hypothetical protein